MTDQQQEFSGFGSTAIHAGHVTDENGAHITPIYASSTYLFDSGEQAARLFKGEEPGYIYGRYGSPTINEAQDKIAALETWGVMDAAGNPLKAKAILHASGMGAITTLMMCCLQKGDKVLSHYSLYGGTQELVDKVLPPLGIEPVIADLRDLNQAETAFKNNPAIKMLYLETPANPTLQCVDIAELTRLAKQYGVMVAADNTFATPYLQRPFAFGVDFIVHSTTKFLNGHGTAIGGVLLGRDAEFMSTKATKWHRLLGANSNGFDAFLLVNGIKTLELRMERHCHNAMEAAHYLDAHPAVNKVNYLGLTHHPDYYTGAKQMQHPGAMLSFELKGGYDACLRFLQRLRLCSHTVSLGTVDTLISHPASTTHMGITEEQRKQYGITPGLLRMNVGVENIQDILGDLESALMAS